MATSQTKAPETLTEAQIKKIKTDNTNELDIPAFLRKNKKIIE